MALVKSHIPWAIKLKNFPEVIGNFSYNTRSQAPTLKYYDSKEVEIVGGVTSATNAGTYYIQFKPRMKYVWPDGTRKIYTAYWTIKKISNTISLSERSGDVKITFTRSFTVNRLGDGTIYASSSNNSIARASVSGNVVTVTGVGVGSATIYVTVAEGTNYLSAETTYSVSSSKTKITIPTVSNTAFTYSGYSVSPTITNAPSTDLVAYGGTSSAVEVGNYSLTFALRNTSAYEWSNGSTSTLSFSWSISKLKFAKPYLESTSLTFAGSSQSPVIANLNSSYMTVSGTQSSTNVGSYTLTVSLKNTKNTCWSDNSTAAVSLSWSISKLKFNSSCTKTQQWAPSYTCATINNYDSRYMNVSGPVYLTTLGTFTATYSLKDKNNTCWFDGSTTDKVNTVTVVKCKLKVSSNYGITKTYTGGTIDITNELYNNLLYDNPVTLVVGIRKYVSVTSTSYTTAGTHTAYVYMTYPDYCEWSDGGSVLLPKPTTWKIVE